MTIEIILWMLGQVIACVGVIITAYIRLADRISENDKAASNRMVKIETTIELMGLNTAKFLHRHDDAFKMDEILDKYIDRHYEMSPAEWALLLAKCEHVREDENVEIFYPYMAGQLAAVCHHKLMHPPHPSMRSGSIVNKVLQ